MTDYDQIEWGCKANGQPMIRTRVLSFIGKLLGIQFKIGGMPYGAPYRTAINTRHIQSDVEEGCAAGAP